MKRKERNESKKYVGSRTYDVLFILTKCHMVTFETHAVPISRNPGYTVSTPTSTLLQSYHELIV